MLKQFKFKRTNSNLLRIVSSFMAILGGTILALNIEISPYGFVVLACSSFLMLLSALIAHDYILLFYSSCLFFTVDLLGIYRWIIS